MTDPDGDLPAELRFKSPGWNLYGGALAISAVTGGFSLVVWGAEVVALWGGPRYRFAIFYAFRGVVVGLAATAITLLFWGLLLWGTAKMWRRWRRLRPPPVVIDDSGVRFEARRRPLMVQWADIDRLVVNRDTYKARLSAEHLSLYLAPNSILAREGQHPQIPSSRRLSIGNFRDTGLPHQVAMKFLERTAGPRVEVLEHELSSEYRQ